MDSMRHPPRSQRALEWVLYVVFSLLVVVSILAYAERSSPRREFPVGPVWVATLTALVFGFVLKALKRFWNSPRFWLTYCGLLGIHFALFSYIIHSMGSHFLLLTSIIAAPEFIIVCVCIEVVVGRR